MKILRCYPFVPPLKGGMENHVKYLSLKQELLNGVEVTVYYNQGDKINNKSQQILKKINLRSLNPVALRDGLFYLAIMRKLLFNNDVQYDVLHIHGDWSAFIFGLIISKVKSIPIRVASVHAKLRNGFLSQKIYKYILNEYDIVYCTGLSEANYLNSLGLSEVNWQPSGVRDEFYQDLPNEPKEFDVIGVGSLLPVKNFNLFLEVAKLLPSHKFLLVGNGELESQLKTKCIDEQISNVYFIDTLNSEELSRYFSKSKILLSTSLTEGTPTIFLEAMVKGLPIVTTASNDYTKLIKQYQNGVIVGYDAENIKNVILKILQDESLYTNISIKNKKVSEDYSWNNIARRITELIIDVNKDIL